MNTRNQTDTRKSGKAIRSHMTYRTIVVSAVHAEAVKRTFDQICCSEVDLFGCGLHLANILRIIYMYIYIYIYIYIHARTHTHSIHVYMCACLYVCIIHTRTHALAHTHTCSLSFKPVQDVYLVTRAHAHAQYIQAHTRISHNIP